MDSKSRIKKELNNSPEDEFDYHGDIGSINAHMSGSSSAKISHFVIKKDERRNGYGSRLFESMIDVLRENGCTTVTVEIQSINKSGENDPVMNFLRKYNFRYIESFEHHNWGDCIRARGLI